MAEEVDQVEADHMSFQIFSQCLRALSYDAAAACDEMGNYNSAGEIWYELTSSFPYVSDLPTIRLSDEQRIALGALASKLREVPSEAMAPGGVMPTSRAACVIAMKHPAWVPLREQAAKLVKMLEPAIQRNQEFLNSL
jgi:hypothetical protein